MPFDDSRVVVHLDLDCFCERESERRREREREWCPAAGIVERKN
jgi:hypothetical protein